MAAMLAGAGLVVALAVGVAALLYNDHKQQKRTMQNGGRRF